MRRIWIALACAGVAAQPAHGELQQGQITFRCNAAPGHFSMMEVVQAPDQQELSGFLQAETMYGNAKWAPSAQVRIADIDSGSWVGVRLLTTVQKKRVITKDASMRLSFASKDQDRPSSDHIVGPVELGKRLAFKIVVRDEDIVLEIAGIQHSMKLKLGARRKIELICSTGNFSFIDVLAQ